MEPENQKVQSVFNNRQQTTRSISQICLDSSQQDGADGNVSHLLCANSTFGHSTMDGKLQVLKIKDNEISEHHFVETTAGVSCAKIFQFKNEPTGNPQDFIVLGYEDGQLHVYDYQRWQSKNYKKLVFNISSQSETCCEERFCESKFAHSDTVTAIEILKFGDLAQPSQFLTASQDGSIKIWKFVQNGD